jgi:hypothetical protein
MDPPDVVLLPIPPLVAAPVLELLVLVLVLVLVVVLVPAAGVPVALVPPPVPASSVPTFIVPEQPAAPAPKLATTAVIVQARFTTLLDA